MSEYSQLRSVLETAVGEPPRQVSVESVRRQARRYRTRHALAAAAAVTAAACMGIAAAAYAAGTGPAGPAAGGHGSHGGGSASVPAYYIQQSQTATGIAADLVVRSTATGAITDTVRCPGRGYLPASNDLAAGSRQTFFMTCERVNGRDFVIGKALIYRFGINAAGHASLPVLLASGQYSELATAEGGSVIAAVAGLGREASGPMGIALLSARTGREAGFISNNLHSDGNRLGIYGLSISADGRELAFFAACEMPIVGCTAPTERILSLPRGGSEPSTASSTVLPDSALLSSEENVTFLNGQLSPDGLTLDIAYFQRHVHGDGRLVVAQRAVRSGRLVRYLYLPSAGKGMGLRFASFDPSGQYAIVDLGNANFPNGWIDHGRFVPLDPASGSGVLDEVW
jgi:hypothetical protein